MSVLGENWKAFISLKIISYSTSTFLANFSSIDPFHADKNSAVSDFSHSWETLLATLFGYSSLAYWSLRHGIFYYDFVWHCDAVCGEDQAFMRYRQPIKIEKPLQSSRRFSLIVYQKNHSGIFKAQIIAENAENNKQLVNL